MTAAIRGPYCTGPSAPCGAVPLARCPQPHYYALPTLTTPAACPVRAAARLVTDLVTWRCSRQRSVSSVRQPLMSTAVTFAARQLYRSARPLG